MSAKRKRRREHARRHATTLPSVAPARPTKFQGAPSVKRLTYSRRQAAEALGVSVATIDRRIVPTIDTVKTPWGQRLIPVDELERFVREHLQARHARAERGLPGRPVVLSEAVVNRIRSEHSLGHTLGQIAARLTAEGVPTAHGGRRWWPSTVRSILLRTSASGEDVLS